MRELDEKVSLCISKNMKADWDQLVKVDKVKFPEILRDFLEDTIPKIKEQIKSEK